jgi:cellulose synthase/poly-beta-1,6-N-acetylglucosamine synthase-like glycosyltransferase
MQQLSTEREERERERWSLLRHARDEAERSLSLAAQLEMKEQQLQQLQEQLQEVSVTLQLSVSTAEFCIVRRQCVQRAVVPAPKVLTFCQFTSLQISHLLYLFCILCATFFFLLSFLPPFFFVSLFVPLCALLYSTVSKQTVTSVMNWKGS